MDLTNIKLSMKMDLSIAHTMTKPEAVLFCFLGLDPNLCAQGKQNKTAFLLSAALFAIDKAMRLIHRLTRIGLRLLTTQRVAFNRRPQEHGNMMTLASSPRYGRCGNRTISLWQQ